MRIGGESEQQSSEMLVLGADTRLAALVAALPFARGRRARLAAVDPGHRHRDSLRARRDAGLAGHRLRRFIPVSE